MGFPLFILSLLSISIGFLTRDIFIGFGTNFWGNAIFVLPQNYVLSDIEFIDLFHKLLPLMISLLGAFSAYFVYAFGLSSFYDLKKTVSFKLFYNFLNRKWYFDRIYNQFIGQNALHLSYHYTYKDIDRGIIEILGPSGIVKGVQSTFNSLNSLQSGFIYHYLFIFLVAVIFFAFISVAFSNFWLSLNIMFFLILTMILI
jgi:NADH-ubiquinone oxidoreductase chain 5